MANIIQTFPKGAGTGGGHTILDTDGTSVAQESKMQFSGMSVTDDATNGITKVAGAGLNQDSIDDIAGSTPSVPSVIIGDDCNYSTSEKIVGKWINNKPVYQKTIQIPVSAFSSATGSEGYYSVGVLHNISNLDVTIKLDGYAYGNVVRPVPFSYGANSPNFKYFASLGINDTTVFIECGTDFRQSVITKNTYGAYVNVQYTKTSD